MNPCIIQRKNLHNKLWKIVQPNCTWQIDAELEEQEFAYFNECGHNLPIELYTTPSLHLLCQAVKERLHVTDDVVFLLSNRARVIGTCIVSGNKSYPSIIIISSGAVNTLNEKELSFLIGHELGHVISRDGVVGFFFRQIYPKDEVPQCLNHEYHVLRLLSELEADRYGFLACGSDIDTFLSFMYKISGGIDIHKFGVSSSTFLLANLMHVQKYMKGGWVGKTHPANALRAEALKIFATSKSGSELRTRMRPIIDSIFMCND